jgi:predicted Zn-dependent protease
VSQELPLLRANVSLEGFAGVLEGLASEVARHLGLALVGGGEGREPHDAAAWRLYLEALADLDVACDVDGPRRRLQDSVRLDPGFAPAWYLLAGTALQRANLCAGSPADYEAATAAADEARRLAPDWAAPEQLACGILLHQGRAEEAMERALAARERFPDHPFVRLRLSEILRYAGLLERSRAEFEAVLASDPAAALQTDVIPYPYLYLERWDRFLELLPGGTSPYHRYYRAWAELQRGSPGAAREILRPGAQTAGQDAFGDLGDALLALLEDRPEDAAGLLARLAAERERRGIGDGELTFKIARLLLEAGEPDEAVRLFDVAARQGFFCPSCLTTPPIAERLRATPDYPRLVRRVEARHEQFVRRFAEPLGPDPRVPLAGSLP